MAKTTIQINESTADVLHRLKDRGETYDEVIQHLLQLPEPFQIRFAPINEEGEPPRYEFVEVENLDGASIDIGGEWEEDGDYSLLVIGEANDG